MTNAYIWPVLVTSIVGMVIGGLWYSPVLFGKQWMALKGMGDDCKDGMKTEGMWKSYLGQFIVTIISVGVLAFIMQTTLTTGWLDGAILGIVLWLGFAMPKDAGSVLWEGSSKRLAFIGTGSSLVILAVSGAILGAWM